MSALNKDVLVSISASVLTKREITGGKQWPIAGKSYVKEMRCQRLHPSFQTYPFDSQASASPGAHSSLPSLERGQWDECIHH